MENKANISILPHTECCGCRACGDVCPKNCISFREDGESFVYPYVEEMDCISCRKCQRVCPELNEIHNPSSEVAVASYALNKRERQSGSSGGIFGLLAEEIILRGGKVWGAAFDEKLKLHHVSASSLTELTPLYRSKYIQSNPTDVYRQIAKDVSEGMLTLFSGTPCQCNAVKNAVGSNEKLITVEVICHGVPSQNLFDRSIAELEKRNNGKIISFTFRSKAEKALHPQSFTYIYETHNKRKTVNGLHYQFPFYFGFQKYITLRPSCYKCKWARPERTADITLGDFWGIEKYDPSLDAKQGVSMVILNTEIGKILFKDIQKSIFTESLPIKAAIENNGCLVEPTKMKPEREALFKALDDVPFDVVVKKFLQPKRKYIFDLYYSLPSPLRRIVRRLMDKRMKYE